MLLALVALSSTVHAQPRAPSAPPDAAAVERWLRRACGVSGPADAAWGAAHVRVPVTLDLCQGEAQRRCRHTVRRDAAEALRVACEVDLVDTLRRGSPHATVAAWVAESEGAHFTARRGARRVEALIGQFGRTLVMVTGADGEATLTAVDDR